MAARASTCDTVVFISRAGIWIKISREGKRRKMDKIRRDKITVALEAVFIGLLNYMIFTFVSTMGVKNTGRALVLAGALIHLGFEYSPVGNINKRWCEVTFAD
tara:strand:+ start:89 stop:397 length:309 start_codon:yes stop_codon:yes gene_type:complete